MDSIKDLLGKKADQMDIEGKRDEISLIKAVVERHFKQGVEVNKVTVNRSAMLKVRNSSLASEVRLQQITLLEEINRVLKTDIERIVVRQ